MPLPIKELPSDSELGALADGGDRSGVTLVLTLLLTSRELLSSTERFFATHGISDGKWSVMMLLASAPKRRLAPSHIAAKLTVTRATVSGLINGLERAGLVTREAHPVDGRAEYVHLSRSGLKLLRTMIPALAGRHAYTVAALTRAERETFVAMLRRLRVPAES